MPVRSLQRRAAIGGRAASYHVECLDAGVEWFVIDVGLAIGAPPALTKSSGLTCDD